MTRATVTPLLPVSLDFPGHDAGLTLGGAYVVRFGLSRNSAITLAEFESQAVPRFDLTTIAGIASADLPSPYAASDLHALADWRLTGGITPTTATANGIYAVRDTLADHRKPRLFRPTVLSTMLVLRIDGKDDSPPLSIGGGGVAAALWRMLPQ